MALAQAAKDVLESFADEVEVLATWHSGTHHRKAMDLAKRMRAFDGTAASANELLEQSPLHTTAEDPPT